MHHHAASRSRELLENAFWRHLQNPSKLKNALFNLQYGLTCETVCSIQIDDEAASPATSYSIVEGQSYGLWGMHMSTPSAAAQTEGRVIQISAASVVTRHRCILHGALRVMYTPSFLI